MRAVACERTTLGWKLPPPPRAGPTAGACQLRPDAATTRNVRHTERAAHLVDSNGRLDGYHTQAQIDEAGISRNVVRVTCVCMVRRGWPIISRLRRVLLGLRPPQTQPVPWTGRDARRSPGAQPGFRQALASPHAVSGTQRFGLPTEKGPNPNWSKPSAWEARLTVSPSQPCACRGLSCAFALSSLSHDSDKTPIHNHHDAARIRRRTKLRHGEVRVHWAAGGRRNTCECRRNGLTNYPLRDAGDRPAHGPRGPRASIVLPSRATERRHHARRHECYETSHACAAADWRCAPVPRGRIVARRSPPRPAPKHLATSRALGTLSSS